MIDLTIKLDTEAVEIAIREAWAREFRVPGDGYRSSGNGAGWDEVMRQVQAHIEKMDLSARIARVARAQIDDVVNQAVTEALRAKAKQRAKEMMRDGTLFAKDE